MKMIGMITAGRMSRFKMNNSTMEFIDIRRINAYEIRIKPTNAQNVNTFPISDFTTSIDLMTLLAGFNPSITIAKGANVNDITKTVR